MYHLFASVPQHLDVVSYCIFDSFFVRNGVWLKGSCCRAWTTRASDSAASCMQIWEFHESSTSLDCGRKPPRYAQEPIIVMTSSGGSEVGKSSLRDTQMFNKTRHGRARQRWARRIGSREVRQTLFSLGVRRHPDWRRGAPVSAWPTNTTRRRVSRGSCIGNTVACFLMQYRLRYFGRPIVVDEQSAL